MDCSFCHLPIPTAGRAAQGEGPLFCCYGCRLAAQITLSRGEAGQVNWMLTRLGLCAFLTMTVMMFSMYLYRQEAAGSMAPPGADDSAAVASQLAGLMRYLCLLFATPVFLLLGLPVLGAAVEQGRRGVWSTDALVVLGVGAAFVYSYVATLTDRGATYYETGCVILVFITLGRWLEAQGKLRASEAVASLQSLFPDRVEVCRGDETLTLTPCDVRRDDLLRVPAGGRIAADGRIETGRAHVDESLVTGESTPVVRERGDVVRAGTLCLDGGLTVRATAVGAASTLGRLIELLEQARRSRSRYERLADRVATAFIPLTAVLAVVGGGFGWRRGGVDDAIMTALAVLLIACPCALGIATPTAVWSALGLAARRGVLFRDGTTLEKLAGVRAICLDKTGTLTTGTPAVGAVMLDGDGDAALQRAAGLAGTSTHALAAGIRAYAADRDTSAASFEDVRTLAGRGLLGHCDAGVCAQTPTTVAMGNLRLMEEQSLALEGALAAAVQRARDAARSFACIGWTGRVRGVFEFVESLRPEARSALAELRGLVSRVCVLTGDHAGRGDDIARALETETESELTPQDKLARLRSLRESVGPVAMVGDGLNDAPALAAADVGLAMGCGADLSREHAGVCLLSNDLAALPWSVRLARRTVRTIRANLFWAFVYNVIGIGLAMTGRLSPVFAAAAMVVSSAMVVTNSLRLSRDPPPQRFNEGVARTSHRASET